MTFFKGSAKFDNYKIFRKQVNIEKLNKKPLQKFIYAIYK